MRIGAIVALFAGPLLCGGLLFWFSAQGQQSGVYLETIDGARALSGSAARTTPGTTIAGAPSVTVNGKPLSFVVIGSPGSPLLSNMMSAHLWCSIVDGNNAVLESVPVPLPAALGRLPSNPPSVAIRQINPRIVSPADKLNGVLGSGESPNPRAYRISLDEFTKERRHGLEGIALELSDRAVALRTSPESQVFLAIGLEIQDSADRSPQMYTVRIGPLK